ncbi:MAG: S8/S53 family peptidase [Ilumatobacteraceae bacterium]
MTTKTQKEAFMNPQFPSTRRRLAVLVTVTALAFAGLGVTGSVGAVITVEASVMTWLDAVSPAIAIDQSNNCMGGASDAVAYRNDRIVLRSSALNNSVKSSVNGVLDTMYVTPNVDYIGAGPIERITFPPPPSGPKFVDVLSVPLLPRSNGQPHDILRLARKLRESHIPASPDYAVASSNHNSFYQPHGSPRWVAAPTPPRINTIPATAPANVGLPIGTGVKFEIYDTGLAPKTPGQLPTTTKLSNTDNELVNRTLTLNDPLLVDYPHAGHGTAIAGVISIIAPGATIQEVRINDRDGLATDVSAARGMASSLRTLSLANYPNIIINAFATAVCDLDPTHPNFGPLQPIGLEAVVEVVDRFDPVRPGGMLIVASAGNMSSRRPHYPAAFTSVLSVGALDGNIDTDLSPWSSASKTAPIADFSNRGSWVEVYGVGVSLPTSHLNGVRLEPFETIFSGAAEVDGTSFAGPAVGGTIAERMSTSGRRARDASVDLINGGKAPLPQCGTTKTETGKAIVLSNLLDPITASSAVQPTTC